MQRVYRLDGIIIGAIRFLLCAGEGLALPCIIRYNLVHMAIVILKEKREIEAGYHIYRQPSPAGDLITVRRKLAMPSDVEHKSSKATRRHKGIFGRAAQRWAAIPAPVRAEMSRNYAWVPIQGHFGSVDTKVLTGRQLFLSQEMHQQEQHEGHAETPVMLCVVTTDKLGRTIDLKLKLRCGHPATGPLVSSAYLAPGNTLFWAIPPGYHQNYIGYAVPGWESSQVLRQTYDELIEMRKQVYYPALWQYEKFEWSWWNRAPIYPDPLYPGSGIMNWDPISATHPGYLWYYGIHPMKQIFGQEYHPYTAYRLLVTKIDDNHHQLDLEPIWFTNEFRIECMGDEPGNVAWHVYQEDGGPWIIDPPQLTRTMQCYPATMVG